VGAAHRHRTSVLKEVVVVRTSTHRRRRTPLRPVPLGAAAAAVVGLAAVAYCVAPSHHPDRSERPAVAAGAPSATTTPPGKGAGAAVGSAAPASGKPLTRKPTAKPSPRPSRAAASHAAAAPGAADLGGCPVAAADSIWRARVDRLPVLSRSSAYISAIGSGAHVHADFGSGTWDGAPMGIPVTRIPAGTSPARVTFDYADESDKGPYPIPPGALIEGGSGSDGDRHVIAVDPSTCRDYELWDAHPQGGSWHAGSGAVFSLTSDALRPDGWTSADAAGLPVLPGLARYDEASRGVIDHALRITVPRSQAAHLWPARHDAGSQDSGLPPMGLRLRLRAGVDISGLPPQARAVAQALKTYGAIVADNGSAWYVSGTQDDRWNNDQLQRLSSLDGSDFEAVDVSGLRVSAGSAAARPSS
jgi:hypothetical protein